MRKAKNEGVLSRRVKQIISSHDRACRCGLYRGLLAGESHVGYIAEVCLKQTNYSGFQLIGRVHFSQLIRAWPLRVSRSVTGKLFSQDTEDFCVELITPKHRSRHNDAATYYIFYYSHFSVIDSAARKLWSRLEAAIGIEPMNKGFADLCLTTWLRRPESKYEG